MPRARRIVITTTRAPFIRGGAEMHARGLAEALATLTPHEVELIELPYSGDDLHRLLDQARAAELLTVRHCFGQDLDLMIGLKFPAWYIEAHRTRLWVLHQQRDLYDLWDRDWSQPRRHPDGLALRAAIHAMDQSCFERAERLFANSRNVAGRITRYHGLAATPLYHPPPLADALHGGEVGDYLFFPSRISGAKRHHLALDALALCEEPVRLVLSGAADLQSLETDLRAKIDEHGLQDRVHWERHVPAERLIALYAGCRAVLFPPIDEDLGYVTLEAMLAEKPVLTLADSGGPLEFIRHEREGFVAEPSPQALAATMDRVWQSSNADLGDLGQAARARYAALDISWETVAARLTEGL